MRARRCADRFESRVRRRQSGGDSLQHPGAAEIESIEMRQPRIARIGHHLGLHGHARREELPQPRRELRLRHDATHDVRLGDTRREEVFARRLVRQGARAVVKVEAAHGVAGQRAQLVVAG